MREENNSAGSRNGRVIERLLPSRQAASAACRISLGVLGGGVDSCGRRRKKYQRSAAPRPPVRVIRRAYSAPESLTRIFLRPATGRRAASGWQLPLLLR